MHAAGMSAAEHSTYGLIGFTEAAISMIAGNS